MKQTILEERVSIIEKQIKALLPPKEPGRDGWLSTVWKLPDDEAMQTILAEGRRIRAQDRLRARRPRSSKRPLNAS